MINRVPRLYKYDVLLGETSQLSLCTVDAIELLEYASASTNNASPSSTVDFDGCRLGGNEFLPPSPFEWEWTLRIGVLATLVFSPLFMSEIASSPSTLIPSNPSLHTAPPLPSPIAFGSISRPTSMGLRETISMSSSSSSSKSSTSQSRRGSARAFPLLGRFCRGRREEPEVARVDASSDHEDRSTLEDTEACPDVKESRSGAPKFPTISSLAIVGILKLNAERVSKLLVRFLKNTCRRLRKNRVIRMHRNL